MYIINYYYKKMLYVFPLNVCTLLLEGDIRDSDYDDDHDDHSIEFDANDRDWDEKRLRRG